MWNDPVNDINEYVKFKDHKSTSKGTQVLQFVLDSQKRYKIGCWQIAGVSNILQLAKQFGIYVWKGKLRIIDLGIWTMV